MTAKIEPRDRLIVALDFATVDEARAFVERVGMSVSFYKVGIELAYGEGGFAFAQELVQSGKKLFIDLKLHDIGNTVTRATRQIARLGATFLTVHAYPQTMKAAREGAGDSGLKLLAVTVLTSYDDSDLANIGYAFNVGDLVARRATQALEAGMDGLILSPEEVEAMRAHVGSDLLLITPGIRPAGSAIGDQKRIMTPSQAIAGGADYLVVGRPVTEAADPKAATDIIVAKIVSGLKSAQRSS